MPYKCEKIPIAGTKYDRRIKITPTDKKEIKILYQNEMAIRAIARKFGVDKRLIQFILFPERQIKAKLNRDWKRYYNKEKWRKDMKEHRAYKYSLYKKGLI